MKSVFRYVSQMLIILLHFRGLSPDFSAFKNTPARIDSRKFKKIVEISEPDANQAVTHCVDYFLSEMWSKRYEIGIFIKRLTNLHRSQ